MKGHKGKKHGGSASRGGREHEVVSGNPDVLKEAEGKESYAKGDEKKHGGRTKHHKRAAGGKVPAGKTIGLMTGGAVRPRLDRPGRKRGGGVGADKSPLSSAHHGGHPGGNTPHSRDTYGGTPSD
jgi:hypothetical protein